MSAPLEGTRVLDLSRLLPGPFCSLVLSELGAAVDKVEDPHAGDYLRLFPPLRNGLSARFSAINRDKRSLCLDLKQEAGRQALLRMLPRYDVLIEGFRPGVMERLGLSYETLSAQSPRLVMCSISGYGQDGPLAERAGHDLNYLALAGVLSQCGPGEEAPPHPLPVQLADIAGGGLWAATGILGALLAAARTGKGRHLDISMCEGSLAFLMTELANLGLEPPPARGGGMLSGGLACYGVYRTRDGRYLSVAALEPKFWQAFCTAIGRRADPAELIAPPAEQRRLREEVQAILMTRTRAEWEAVFEKADAMVEPVLDPAEVPSHPQHLARQVFFEIAGAEQPFPQVRTPLRERARLEGARPPPAQGQHSDEILGECGFTGEEIARLRAARVVR